MASVQGAGRGDFWVLWRPPRTSRTAVWRIRQRRVFGSAVDSCPEVCRRRRGGSATTGRMQAVIDAPSQASLILQLREVLEPGVFPVRIDMLVLGVVGATWTKPFVLVAHHPEVADHLGAVGDRAGQGGKDTASVQPAVGGRRQRRREPCCQARQSIACQRDIQSQVTWSPIAWMTASGLRTRGCLLSAFNWARAARRLNRQRLLRGRAVRNSVTGSRVPPVVPGNSYHLLGTDISDRVLRLEDQ